MTIRKTPTLILLAAAAVVPHFLRRRMRIFKRIMIAARAETIFPFVNDARNWPLWLEWGCGERAAHHSYDGPAAGAGAMQEIDSAGCHGTLKIVSSIPDTRVVFHLALEPGGHRAEGVVALDRKARGTLVRVIVKWDGAENPYARYGDLVKMMFAAVRMSRSLRKLKSLAESATPPSRGGE